MKKISRLTALLLALLIILSSAAFATENVYKADDLTLGDYALMVAVAKDANEAVGKTAVVNQDQVEVHDNHFHAGVMGTKVIDHLDKGTIVSITSYEEGILHGAFWDSHWYGVSYEKDGAVRAGYIQAKYLTVQQSAPDIVYTPWDGVSESVKLSYSVDGAAAYEWQRGLLVEEGSISWESILEENGSELNLLADSENLKYAYRCIAMSEKGIAIATSGEVMLVDAERAMWLASAGEEVSQEMLQLAMQASSLDSMMLVGNELIHVRTGEVFAFYDEGTGELTDTRFSLVFARLENNALVPFTAQSAEADPAAAAVQ